MLAGCCAPRKKVAEVEFATAFASSVFPVPGSPYRMTPFGGLIPMSSYLCKHVRSCANASEAGDAHSSGCVSGSSTASLISWIWSSRPPMSAYDSSGAFST